MNLICVISKGERTEVWPLELEPGTNPIQEIKRQLFAKPDGSWNEDRQEDWDSAKEDLHWFHLMPDAASFVDMVDNDEISLAGAESEGEREVLYRTLELVFEQFRIGPIMRIVETEEQEEAKETYDNWADVARDLFDVTLQYYKETFSEEDFTPHLVEGTEAILKEKDFRYNLIRRDFAVWCSLKLDTTPLEPRLKLEEITKITQYPGEILSVLSELVREYIDETYHMGDPFLGETTKEEAIEDFQLYYYASWVE